MKKIVVCVLAAVMAACFCLAGCGKKLPEFNAEEAFAKLLSDVKFDSELTDVSSAAAIMLGDLPEGAAARMYTADSPNEDALIMLTAKNAEDVEALSSLVREYLDSRLYEAERYAPEQVQKLKNCRIFESGNTVIACVTNDAEKVAEILK